MVEFSRKCVPVIQSPVSSDKMGFERGRVRLFCLHISHGLYSQDVSVLCPSIKISSGTSRPK